LHAVYVGKASECIKIFGRFSFYRMTRMHSTDYAVARCLSVHPSVHLSHASILSKQLCISSKVFHHWVAPLF